jgi:hypothetical protein
MSLIFVYVLYCVTVFAQTFSDGFILMVIVFVFIIYTVINIP